MKKKYITSMMLFLAGEALIITCFLHFGKSLEPEILTLNIVISSTIYSLFFLNILFPRVDFKDKSQKVIGSLGLREFSTTFYSLLAIGVMTYFIFNKPTDIYSQIIIQAILFFFLLVGLYSAATSAEKVHEVFLEEKQKLNNLEELRKKAKDVKLKIDQAKGIPSDIVTRITVLHDDLRFIPPCNDQQASLLESNFIKEMKAIQDCLYRDPVNTEKMMESIQNCERIFKDRKQIFSN